MAPMSFVYHTFFFDPLYNALVLLVHYLPWADAGVLVILFTSLVRLALFPLSKKAVVTQIRMNEIAPELEKIKEKYKDRTEEQAKHTLALYREKGVNPFSGVLVILIQLPLIFALYRIFLHFSDVRTDLLYSFVPAPETINTMFLGLIHMTQPSFILALFAAASTFFQLKFSLAQQKAPTGDSFGENLSKNIQSQTKYFLPLMMFFISYKISAVIPLYFITTNLFSIGQEIFMRKRVRLA